MLDRIYNGKDETEKKNLHVSYTTNSHRATKKHQNHSLRTVCSKIYREGVGLSKSIFKYQIFTLGSNIV